MIRTLWHLLRYGTRPPVSDRIVAYRDRHGRLRTRPRSRWRDGPELATPQSSWDYERNGPRHWLDHGIVHDHTLALREAGTTVAYLTVPAGTPRNLRHELGVEWARLHADTITPGHIITGHTRTERGSTVRVEPLTTISVALSGDQARTRIRAEIAHRLDTARTDHELDAAIRDAQDHWRQWDTEDDEARHTAHNQQSRDQWRELFTAGLHHRDHDRLTIRTMNGNTTYDGCTCGHDHPPLR